MKGNVLDFSVQTNSGIISGDDQNRYMFAGTEWRGENAPKSGDRVDFDIDLDGDAILVFNALGETQIPQKISDQLPHKLRRNWGCYHIPCGNSHQGWSDCNFRRQSAGCYRYGTDTGRSAGKSVSGSRSDRFYR